MALYNVTGGTYTDTLEWYGQPSDGGIRIAKDK